MPDCRLDRGASARQRTLEAIRRHFRDYGGSPSQRELSIATGIRAAKVGTILRHLAIGGMIRLRPGEPRGIELLERAAMLSDAEFELIARARGAVVSWPAAAVAPLADLYHVETDTDWGLPAGDLLAQIDAAEEDQRHGRSAGNSSR